MLKISSKKLAEIRDYYLEGGDTDSEVVIEQFGLSGEEELAGYQIGLRQKYPNDFPDPAEEPEPEFSYFLKQDTGLLQELEVVKNKNGVLVFSVKEPKDLVTIMVKGKPVEVDLVKLRKLPTGATEHGLPVARLIELAEISR